MIAVICVDERNGMMFQRRRQTQDRRQREDLLKECGDKALHMNAYSAAMFEEEAKGRLKVEDDFIEKAKENEYCFIEDRDIGGCQDNLESVILYKWNRRYPADVYFTLDLEDGSWELADTKEIEGFSHELITREVYKKII